MYIFSYNELNSLNSLHCFHIHFFFTIDHSHSVSREIAHGRLFGYYMWLTHGDNTHRIIQYTNVKINNRRHLKTKCIIFLKQILQTNITCHAEDLTFFLTLVRSEANFNFINRWRCQLVPVQETNAPFGIFTFCSF